MLSKFKLIQNFANILCRQSNFKPGFCMSSLSSNLESYISNDLTIKQLKERGIEQFFPIQYECYKYVMEGKDILARDRTGSGKTLSYSLPLTEKLRQQGFFSKLSKNQKPLILVLVPTRELVTQVVSDLKLLRHNNDFRVLGVYGGIDIQNHIQAIRSGIEVIVGTPGRTIDLLNRGVLDLSDLRSLVLDECDEMLNMGFQDDIEKVYEFVNKNGTQKVQNMLYSATMPQWVHKISSKYIDKERKLIDLVKNSENKTAQNVEHIAIQCDFKQRASTIGDVVLMHGGYDCKTIIFTETKHEANQIMLDAHIKQEVQVLHGDIPQNQREVTFKAFRDGKIKCLIATNVAARGLDIKDVDLVIQLDPPKDIESFIHRAGRTARAGKSGKCITFYSTGQTHLIKQIEKEANISFKKCGAPQPLDIISSSVRDILLDLKGVETEMLPLFKDASIDLINEIGSQEALQRALAVIAGYTKSKQMKQRSLLTSKEGFISYQMIFDKEIRSTGVVWAFLNANFQSDSVQNISKMQICADYQSVILDIPMEEQTVFDDFIKKNENNSFQGFIVQMQICTELPELIERPTYDRNSSNQRRPDSYSNESRNESQRFSRNKQHNGFQQNSSYSKNRNNQDSQFSKSDGYKKSRKYDY